MIIGRAEVFAILLAGLGGYQVSQIGVDFFHNRYIAVPFIILVGIGYIFMKREEKHGRKSADNTH